jgi:hypothetical protein
MRAAVKSSEHQSVALEKILGSRRGAMRGWQVRALVLGALTSTNLRLGPQHLLAHILGSESPVLETIDQAKELMGALANLWNALARECAADGQIRLSTLPLAAIPSVEELHTYVQRRHDEILWFTRGIDAGGDDPAEFGARGQELFRRLGEASALCEAYRDLLDRKAADTESPAARRDSAKTLAALTGTVEGLLEDLAHVGQAVRAEALTAYEDLTHAGRTDDGVRVGPEPPGRNTPCPCGSGQKFRRCCGRMP